MSFVNDRRHPRQRHGVATVYTCVALLCLMCFASLATDWARVVLVRTELQTLADAAALAAVGDLNPGGNDEVLLNSAASRAEQTFRYNKVNGAAIPFDRAGHLEFGRWDAPNPGFNALTPAAALHADCVRIRVAGTVPLLFGSVLSIFDGIGKETFGVSAQAVAQIQMPQASHGVIGLEGVTVTSAAARIDSYDSTVGPYASSRDDKAGVASNGTWNLHKHAKIDGDLFYLGNNYPTGGNVSGARREMSSPIVRLPLPVPSSVIHMGSHKGGSLQLGAGDYYFDSFTLKGKNSLTTTGGKVRLFINGGLSLAGSTSVSGGIPSNLEIHLVGGGKVELDLKGTTQLHAMIYAPESDAHMTGTGDLFGGIVARQLTLAGNSAIHSDTAGTTLGQPIRRLMQ